MRRGRRAAAGSWALVAFAAIVVGNVRWRAESVRAAVKETSETYLLPPAEELSRLSLGYRSAVADYLWAHVMVTQGLRLGERRRFETVVDYIDTITSLDPDFREPFRLADTLTTMQAKSATIEDVRAARLILEKGVARFPNDAELWLNLGGFVTWIAPTSYLTDPEEQRRWRIEGAGYLGRAAELGSEDANLAWQAIGGARALVRAGERDASIRFYRRALATTRDEGLRSEILKLLGALEGQEAVDAQRARQARLESVWRESYPAWTLTALQLSPPPFDVARCAGGSAAPLSEAPLCARTWRNWTQRVDAEIRSEHLARPPSIGEPTTQPAPRIP